MQTPNLKIENVPLDSIRPDPENARAHDPRNVESIKASLERFGLRKPLVVSTDGTILAGNGTYAAAQALGWKTIAIARTNLTGAEARAYSIVDNRSTDLSKWDSDILLSQLDELPPELQRMMDFTAGELALLAEPINLPGEPEADGEQSGKDHAGALVADFIEPPFSILDGRSFRWQERRRAWLALGLKGDAGRGAELLNFSTTAATFGRGRGLTFHGVESLNDIHRRNRAVQPGGGGGANSCWLASDGRPAASGELSGTSLFCPALMELLVKWFTPPGGLIVDPFSGGATRGVVSSMLDRRYIGCDIRAEQVAADEKQGRAICSGHPMPRWLVGDSTKIAALVPKGTLADAVITSPPFYNLEVYSDDPRDLSNMPYPVFLAAIETIMRQTCSLLRPDRFCVIAIGEVRDKVGNYVGLVPDVVKTMQRIGLSFYGEAIHILPCGSLPLRVRRQFEVGRKLGKSHENILVFTKGSARKAAADCGPVECGDITSETTPLPGEPGGES